MATVQDIFDQVQARIRDAQAVGDMNTIAAQIPIIEGLLQDAPNTVPLVFALATCRMMCGSPGVALPYFEWLSHAEPDSPEVFNNLGSCWKALNYEDEARGCWEQALERKDHPDYYNNLATLCINRGCPEKGIPYMLRALSMDPNQPRIHWNLSLLLLEQGLWKEGFEHYEAGLYSTDRPVRFYDKDPEKVPFWDGESPGKVVVYGEQGIGDEIMAMSMLNRMLCTEAVEAIAKDEIAHVVVECHERLINLFRRSFPGVPMYPTRKNQDMPMEWAAKENLDFKVAAGSLFRLYAPKGNFDREPYLKADPELVLHYRLKLRKLGPGPYVGIGWKAGTPSTRGDLRSLKLGWFAPLYEKGGTFVSLQYTADAEEKAEKQDWLTHWKEAVEAGPGDARYVGFDYDHTAALVEALDLVIAPNTSVVHLCGALGKECWTLTPDAPAWRYQLTGDRMPFYGDHVKQIRQEGRSWQDVLEFVGRQYARLYCGPRTEPSEEPARA